VPGVFFYLEDLVSDSVNPQEPGVVVGYKQSQPRAAVDAVNVTKNLENELGDWIDELRDDDSVTLDHRWVAIAVTHLQQGFMALNRAVFQPESRLR
jgi:hypothetical protein